MAKDEKAKVVMFKPIQNMSLSVKTPGDRPIIQLINEMARYLPGIDPKSATKNLLQRSLPVEIERLRSSNGQLIGMKP